MVGFVTAEGSSRLLSAPLGSSQLLLAPLSSSRLLSAPLSASFLTGQHFLRCCSASPFPHHTVCLESRLNRTQTWKESVCLQMWDPYDETVVMLRPHPSWTAR